MQTLSWRLKVGPILLTSSQEVLKLPVHRSRSYKAVGNEASYILVADTTAALGIYWKLWGLCNLRSLPRPDLTPAFLLFSVVPSPPLTFLLLCLQLNLGLLLHVSFSSFLLLLTAFSPLLILHDILHSNSP